MELTRLKAKLKTALRGHKLLKDKRDEPDEAVHAGRCAAPVSCASGWRRGWREANAAFTVASAVMSPEMLEQALLAPRLSTEVDGGPAQHHEQSPCRCSIGRSTETQPDLACYGFAQTSGELDDALQALNRVYSDLLELAQAEKTVQLLAQDIEQHPPPGQRTGVCGDPGKSAEHPLHHHEAGGE